tara:strand:- start:645 stop:1004 length:360 start_codon:yes stop_codon:yes gene_type:complete
MLNDEDAINDVNPFVTHDFSLPGGMRQTGEFGNFSELKKTVCKPVSVDDRSVFCDFGLCNDQLKPVVRDIIIQPKRNIDTGFTCPSKKKKVVKKEMRIPYFGIFLCVLFILLIVLYSGR